MAKNEAPARKPAGRPVKKQVKKRKKRSRIPLLLLLIIILLALTGWSMVFGGTRTVNLDEQITVTIPEGTSAQQVATILDESGLIKNELSFRVMMKMEGEEGNLRPGVYTFGPGKVTYGEILEELKKGNDEANAIKVTIPEGYTVDQVAARLEEQGVCSAQEFLDAASYMQVPYGYIPQSGDYHQLEGFLFPDTYSINRNMGPIQIIEMMLAEFDENWTEDRQARADEMGYSVYQIVTVASLVEREARVDSERPMIASVIYNRLDADMLLQIDATVQYALGEQKDRLLYSDLQIESPYNTYKYTGLPVGPIASPGLACIDAALYPADTPYYYYQTSKEGDGSHYFCETFAEHEAYRAQK
ncbi:MAG: endolytic transglycosylase MltG [Firmicutes bacterium]|nr:endolytic transglycosylase MltG [Bacillota bacterium]